MSVEEYEQWRKKMGAYPTETDEARDEEIDVTEQEDEQAASPKEMKESLTKLLQDLVESEKQFVKQLKEVKASEKRRKNTEEEDQQLEAYREEKSRIQRQLKFIKTL